MRILPICLIAFLAFALPGCQSSNFSVHETWKSGKKFYFTHVNTPAKLDISDRTVLESAERALVQHVMRIDEELTRLEKAMDALASPPNAEQGAEFLRRFPWLSGITLLAPDGTQGASIPPTPLKRLDYAPLLETAPKTLPRDLRASVQDTDMGPEILLARPFLQGDQVQVILVATFDFRALLPFTSSPDDLIVRSPDVLIWNGNSLYEKSPLSSIDWNEQLRKETNGILPSQEGSFLWLTRYLQSVPLVFATVAK